ncbi:sigma factor-like helix-turn-helix DNA-binding protein [Streptomyces sp. NPDC088124]|uniref:sigma factor-like helix-turn-helix DNA-binding protein n=1 Tax=Streptomyces sp. NPDC088124 TaxID=3154654 RepID=UPI003430FDDB
MTRNTTQNTPQPTSADAPDAPGTPGAALPSPEERRRLREAKAMTEKQAAATVGVTRATLRNWETGRKTPRGRKGEAYARLLAGIAAELRLAEERARRTERAAARAAQERSAARQRHHSTAPKPATAPKPEPEPASAPKPATAPKPEPEPASASASASAPNPGPASPSQSAPASPPDSPTDSPSVSPSDSPTVSPSASASESASDRAPGPAVEPGVVPVAFSGAAVASLAPDQAFDALYTCSAPALVRQTYLLTGRRALSQESVERAFHCAWESWPRVAVDRDPVGWVRAAAHEYAMSPWRRLRRAHRRPDPVHGEQEHEGADSRALREALLALPPSYRRALLLYDGLGLDLPETAAETEASTPATAHRLMRARKAVAARVPELTDAESLHERLSALVRAVTSAEIASAKAVRKGSERRATIWTRAAIAFTVLIIGATSFTLATAPRQYEPRQAPGERVGGVPVPGGPERLSPEDLRLRDALRTAPATGPYRLVPVAR